MSELYVAREHRLAARRVAGEMVILSADDSSLYVLNEIGALLWEAADGQTPLREIVTGVICAEYDVDAATGLADAEVFVRELVGHGILRLSATPVDEASGTPASEEIPWAR